MGIEKEWEKARDKALGVKRQISGLLKCADWHLPDDLDQSVTQPQFDALVRWENELSAALDELNFLADDLIVSEHLKIENKTSEENLQDVMKPVGFSQGVSR